MDMEGSRPWLACSLRAREKGQTMTDVLTRRKRQATHGETETIP